MITAEQISIIEEGQDFIVICRACQTVLSRIPSSAQQAELEKQIRAISDLHLAKCTGDLG
jgi:hypothetical protein